MDEEKRDETTEVGCPEQSCEPCINRSDCAREDQAMAEAVADEAQANAAVEQFCAAAEDLIAATTEKPVLSTASQEMPCVECREHQANALLSELSLRHAAEERRDEALVELRRAFEERQRAETERDAAIGERDARIADEALRAQRVDVEALREKVLLMKKNLAAVDARADERYALDRRLLAEDCEKRIADTLSAAQVSIQQALAAAKEEVAAVRAEVQPAIDELAKVRAGEQVRVEALNAAMELIWATGRRDKGAPRNDRELVVALTQILSAARVHAQ